MAMVIPPHVRQAVYRDAKPGEPLVIQHWMEPVHSGGVDCCGACLLAEESE